MLSVQVCFEMDDNKNNENKKNCKIRLLSYSQQQDCKKLPWV